MKHALSLKLFLCFSLVLLLVSCGTTPEKPDTTEPPQSTEHLPRDQQIKQLLIDAEASPSPVRERLMIDAIKLLRETNNLAQINYILTQIQPIGLPSDTYGEFINLAANIHIQQKNFDAANELLESEETLNQLPFIPPPIRQSINLQRAQLFAHYGQYPKAVELRILLSTTLAPNESDERIEQNYDALWQALMYIPTQELNDTAASSTEDTKGWYALAALSKDYSDIDQQLAQLNLWIANWPNHPAKDRLPQRLVLLQTLAQNKPKNIAIFLPLTGKLKNAGNAILEGFFAAYYQSLASGSNLPKVNVIDTSSIHTDDFLTTYNNHITAHEVDLVIGPLAKDKVKLLAQQPTLPTPSLALNYIEQESPTPITLYQFGLAVEDEIVALTTRASIEGYKQALILTPETSWGNRAALSLQDKWIEAGGTVTSMNSFKGNNDYSSIIQASLNVLDSKKRAKRIKRYINQKFEFLPRRRQDIDVIFLAASADQARQIKPTLAFHYGGDIPVLTTSRVFSGKVAPDIDRDLAGIVFTDIPWIYEESVIKKSINDSNRIYPQYQRLVALGIDTFRLYPRLKQLETIPDTKLYGKTGNLQLKEGRIIAREQVWGIFKNGKPKLIPTLTKTENPPEPQT